MAAEPHPLRETGEAADAREHEQHSEHHRKGRALNDGLQSRAHEAADRARRPEPEKHLSVDPRSNDEETDERPSEVGERDHRDREAHVELRREDRREHATDAEPGDRSDRARDDRGDGRHDGERAHALILLRG